MHTGPVASDHAMALEDMLKRYVPAPRRRFIGFNINYWRIAEHIFTRRHRDIGGFSEIYRLGSEVCMRIA